MWCARVCACDAHGVTRLRRRGRGSATVPTRAVCLHRCETVCVYVCVSSVRVVHAVWPCWKVGAGGLPQCPHVWYACVCRCEAVCMCVYVCVMHMVWPCCGAEPAAVPTRMVCLRRCEGVYVTKGFGAEGPPLQQEESGIAT